MITWDSFVSDASALCRKITVPVQSVPRLSAAGPRLCEMGNSGAQIKMAVIKEHEDARAEGLFCKHLGEQVAPKVYRVSDRYESPEYYIMEYLDPLMDGYRDDLLQRIERILEQHVWSRQVMATPNADTWMYSLKERYGVTIPPVLMPNTEDFTEDFCLIHGDCTVANLMRRENRYIITDPVWYRHFVPSVKATDCGKMLQSAAGWEYIAYGQEFVLYENPKFAMDPRLFAHAIFWCAVNMLRIRYREVRAEFPRPHVIQWCRGVLDICEERIGRHWEW